MLSFVMNAKVARHAVTALKASMGDKYKPSLQQIKVVNYGDGTITMSTLDGFRIHEFVASVDELEGDHGSVLIPMFEVPKGAKSLVFNITDTQLSIRTDDGRLIDRSFEPGTYPDIDRFIDMGHDYERKFCINTKFLSDLHKLMKDKRFVEVWVKGETDPIHLITDDHRAMILPVRPPRNK